MPSNHEMAVVARSWLKKQRVHRYHLKKISDMDDREVLNVCHWWNEENHMTREFSQYEWNRLYADSAKQSDRED